MKLPQAQAKPEGMALILTVFMVSLLTILMVGFLSNMMTEKRAAHAYEDSQRAKLLAQGAVSHAIDVLRTNIPEPARLSESPATAPAENWIVNPGRLTIIKQGAPPQYVPLHTGEVTSLPPADQPRDAESVDLNRPIPGSTHAMIAPEPQGGQRPEMRVKWVNTYQDPALPPSKENPLVGRYAFWMDDENAKINYNLALGKSETGANGRFTRQLNAGHVTPLFQSGGGITSAGGGERLWALGRPQSVNFDVLLDKPSQLKRDELTAHMFLQGFTRYPEAILKFLDVPDPTDWYERNKFNFTFYNRGPEFNAFGLPRLFPSYIPLSLEIGPSYQHPFLYKSGGKTLLHTSMLLGAYGVSSYVDFEGRKVDADNRMVFREFEMLMEYMGRVWPGYESSFIDKYGWDESAQIVMNMLNQARYATSDMKRDGTLREFTDEWSTRATSINFVPHDNDMADNFLPERWYWRLKRPDGKTKLMIPTPNGPMLSEIRLIVESVNMGKKPTHGNEKVADFILPKHVQYKFEYEFYAPPSSPVIDLEYLIPKFDFMEISSSGADSVVKVQNFDLPNWNHGDHLGPLQTKLPADTHIGPKTSRQVPLGPRSHRVVVSSQTYLVGVLPRQVPRDANFSPRLFDATKNQGGITVKFRFRAGLGVKGNPQRPYMMYPLGESNTDDVLEATFNVNLNSGTAQAVSWQLEDPRLGIHASEWAKGKTGPGPLAKTGTIGAPNKVDNGLVKFNEPEEESSQKSKFKFLMRSHDNSKLFVSTNYNLNRGDEYQTNGRVSSPGYWSMTAAGIQNKKPWKSLSLSKPEAGELPDFLLLDLFGGIYPMAHDQWKIEQRFPDEFSTSSFMNSTAGQVNLNTKIYPDTPHFRVPARTAPLKAVFKHLYSDAVVDQLVKEVNDYQTSSRFFAYQGELANVEGVDGGMATEWDRERILRNMAGILTTKSNTFGVWGVAQGVKKARSNHRFDAFEKNDSVTGEKRFYALVERYIWTGKDGVPGNGHSNQDSIWDKKQKQPKALDMTGGTFDTVFELPGSPPLKKPANDYRLALEPKGAFPVLDGPEPVFGDSVTKGALGDIVYEKTSLEDAYNPPQAAIKYRVVYFKFLDN